MATKTKLNKKDKIEQMFRLGSTLRAIATAAQTTVDFVREVLIEKKLIDKLNSNTK